MRLISYGISFHDTALEYREQLAFTEPQQQEVLCAIHQSEHVHEGLILCTCNRTELYFYAEDDYDTEQFVTSLIERIAPSALETWSNCHHVYEDTEAIRHLFTVGSGLDSQMIGESQVIRQLKDAYKAAIESQTTKFFFHRLMHRAFRTSKAVHTQTDINCGAVSISAAAVELAKEKLNLAGANVLLIGAGESASLAAKYLTKSGIKVLTVASRTLETATELTAKLKMGTPCTLVQIPDFIDQADLILCSTAAETPIITEAKYKYLLSKDNHSVLILDIAVPRDVDAEIGALENVQLYNIEDLNNQVQNNLQQRSCQVPKAMEIVDRNVQRFDQWLKSLNVNDIVATVVDEYQVLAADEVNRYSKLFPDLNADELQKFAESLVKKVLHGPIKYLKDSSGDDLASDQLQAMDLIKKMLLDIDRKRGSQ
ncbi:MAG: glutamyl-tRNA reductase [Planctomycetota bacterium]|jgi:glutamyl-tRNA reductase